MSSSYKISYMSCFLIAKTYFAKTIKIHENLEHAKMCSAGHSSGPKETCNKGTLSFCMVLTNAWQAKSSSHAQQNATLPSTLTQTCRLAAAPRQQQSHFHTAMLGMNQVFLWETFRNSDF